MLIRPTSLVLKELFFCTSSVLTRLVRLISTKTKEYFFGRHLCIRSMRLHLQNKTYVVVASPWKNKQTNKQLSFSTGINLGRWIFTDVKFYSPNSSWHSKYSSLVEKQSWGKSLSTLSVSQVWVTLLTSSASTLMSRVTLKFPVNFPSSSLAMSTSSLCQCNRNKLKFIPVFLAIRKVKSKRTKRNGALCSRSWVVQSPIKLILD